MVEKGMQKIIGTSIGGVYETPLIVAWLPILGNEDSDENLSVEEGGGCFHYCQSCFFTSYRKTLYASSLNKAFLLLMQG